MASMAGREFRRLLPWCVVGFSLLAPTVLHAAESRLSNFLAIRPDNPYFPFLIIFGALMGALTFFKPKIGLVVMLFFIMISTDMPTKGEAVGTRPVTIRIEDFVLVLVSFGWMLNRAKTRSLSIFKDVPVNRAILPLALLIVLCTIIGYLTGTVRGHSGILFSMKRLQYFWIFFMTLNLIDTEREARIAVWLFLGAAAVVSLIGSAQFVLFPMSDLAAGGATATTGFGRANAFASFLLTMIGLVMGWMLFEVNQRKLLLVSGVFILLLGALLMTKSRGAYVSLVPLMGVILWVTRSRRGLTVLALLVTFMAGYFIVKLAVTGDVGLLVSKHYNDFGYQFSSIGKVAQEGIESDSSLNARYLAWEYNWPRILSRPFFGHGVGSIPLGSFDNHYVREMYETGFLGLFAFLFMNAVILLTMRQFYLRTANLFYKGLAIGFFGGHVGILVHAMAIENFYTIVNMEAFWFALALLMVFYDHEARREWRTEVPEAEPRLQQTALPEGFSRGTP